MNSKNDLMSNTGIGSNGNSMNLHNSHHHSNNNNSGHNHHQNQNGLLNGLNSKLFLSNNSGNQSSSPITQSLGHHNNNNSLTPQQQIMMQSPSVNMSAIAAYGQQPALMNNANNTNNNNTNNNSSSNNQYNNNNYYYVDEFSSFNNHKQSIQWFDLEIKGMVKNISPKLWQWTHLRCLYLNDNNLMRLPPVIASLNHLQCLDASNNKIRTLPSEIGDMTSLRELFLNNNQIRVLPFEFGKLFKLQQLGLKGNPLTPDMMQLFMEPNGTQKLLIHLLDQLTITCPPPPRRPWMILAEPSQNSNTSIFTTMCYNVLCDKYATRQYYGYCPAWALTWDYRKKLILDDIKNFNADVIALQELETEQFYQFFLPELRQYDYDGIFSPKSRAKTMSEQDKKHVDGCAIMFKTSRFQLVKDYLVEFNQIAMATAEGSEDMLNRVMTKDNIGLAALLEVKQEDSSSNSDLTTTNTNNSKSPNIKEQNSSSSSSSSSTSSSSSSSSSLSGSPTNKQMLLVCTAHIHWDPDYCDVKLIQTLMFTNEIKLIIEQAQREFRPNQLSLSNGQQQQVDCSSSIPVVICADLNSLPESGVIEYLRTGRILANHVDFKDLGYDSCLQKINTSDKPSELSHNLKLECAYNKEIMPYTNYTFDFKGMIDYIFYSSQLMRTVGLLGPLDIDWIKTNKIVGFPHPHVPSDHLPLMVELELFTNNTNSNNQNNNNNNINSHSNSSTSTSNQQHNSHFQTNHFQSSSSSNNNSSSTNLRPNQHSHHNSNNNNNNNNNHNSHHNSHHHHNHHHHSSSQSSSHNNSLNNNHSSSNHLLNSNSNNNSSSSSIGQMIPINNSSSTSSNNNNSSNNGINFNLNFLHSNLKK